MDTFDDIVNKNVALLVSKGYGNHSLHSFVGLDQFAKEFEEGMIRALERVDFEGTSQYFHASLLSIQNNDADVAHINLQYLLNHSDNTVAFDGLMARMRDEFVGIRTPAIAPELPSPSAVYRALINQEQLRKDTPAEMPDKPLPNPADSERFLAKIRTEMRTLLSKEYLIPDSEGLLKPKNFFGHVKDQVGAMASRTHQLSDLIIVPGTFTRGLYNNKLHLRLGYLFHPLPGALQFYGVQGQLDDHRLTYMPKDAAALPHFDQMYNDLTNMRHVHRVKELYNEMSSIQGLLNRPRLKW